VQSARVHLGEDDEHRRDQGGEHRIIDAPHCNAREGKQEEQGPEQERLVHRARDRAAAIPPITVPATAAARGARGHRMRLETMITVTVAQ